ncbi:hypothetical protein AHF37_11712 [Paragonimus kellicotti]|nr:hypothetical protein AHF37_11712 [Paragonimus kellicotti]
MAKPVVTVAKAGPDPSWPYCGVKLTIHNIIIPEERLKPTPSEFDNMDSELETELRVIGCELIQDSGVLLRLPQVAMATAQVLYQRFFYSKSFVRHFYEHYAMACVFLAAKLEECPRRIRDIINVFHHARQVREQRSFSNPTPVMLDQSYTNLKNQVIKAERRILKELGFCVHAKHPHKLIICYLKALEQETNARLVQCAWNYMNDSLRTNVFVRYLPEAIACACIYLASCKLGIPLPRHPAWWEMFTVDEDSVHEISLCLMRLYARPKSCVTEVEAELAKLRKNLMEAKERELESKKQTQANITPPVHVSDQGSVDVSPTPDAVTEKSVSFQSSGTSKPNELKYSDSNDRLLPPNSVLANAIATAKAVAANITASKGTVVAAAHSDQLPTSPTCEREPGIGKMLADSKTADRKGMSNKLADRQSPESTSKKDVRHVLETGSSGRPAAYPHVSPEMIPAPQKRRHSEKRGSKRHAIRLTSHSLSTSSTSDADQQSKDPLPPNAYVSAHPRRYRLHKANLPTGTHSTSGSETPTSSPSPVKRRRKSVYRNRSRSRSSTVSSKSSTSSVGAHDHSRSHSRKKHSRKSRHRASPPLAYRLDKIQETYHSFKPDSKHRPSSQSSALANGGSCSFESRSHHRHKNSEVSDRRSTVSREHKR